MNKIVSAFLILFLCTSLISFHALAATTTTVFTSGFEEGPFNSYWNDNEATTWLVGTNSTPGSPWVTHSGTNMSYAGNAQDGNITSDNINLLGASQAGIDFWYMVDDEEADDYRFYYYDGTVYDLQATDLGLAANEDQWYHYSEIITASEYLISNFQLRFWSTADANEASFLDDVSVNKTSGNYTYTNFQAINFWASNTKAMNLALLETASLIIHSSGTSNKAINFLNYGATTLWSYISTSFQIATSGPYFTGMFEILNIEDSPFVLKAITFLESAILYLYSLAEYNRANLFSLFGTANLAPNSIFNKAKQYWPTAWLRIYEYGTINKALTFINYGLLQMLDYGAATFQLSIGYNWTFTLNNAITFFANRIANKALAFTPSVTLTLWDTVTMNRALWLPLFEIFQTVMIDSYLSFSTIITVSTDIILAIAVLALVLSISGIGLFFLRRRKEAY